MRKVKIAIVLFITALICLWFYNGNKERTITVQEDGIEISVTVIRDGNEVIIKSEMTNVTKRNKKVIFSTPCNKGIYYRTSENFHKYYEEVDGGCMQVLEEYEIKPKKKLTNEKVYRKKKAIILERIHIMPGRTQSELEIKL